MGSHVNLNVNPKIDLRRLRLSRHTRDLVADVVVSSKKLIQPVFAVDGIKDREPVPTLTGVYRETRESLIRQTEADLERGVEKFILFGVPNEKAEKPAQFAFATDTIAALKRAFGHDLWLAVDVCLCSYTSHGHCGVIEGDHIDNGASVEILAEAALAYAQAGADCVAPSDMMDGRVGAIRSLLDSKGFEQTVLLSYAAKFHSRFYGPFRAAADSAPKPQTLPETLKDRATYQIDPASFRDALQAAQRDADEGADILMVKPGLPYLDVLYRLSQSIEKPFAVYEVSGEYGAIETMANQGLMRGPEAHCEAWTSFFRAGASMVLTYGARFAREWLHT